MDDKEEEQKPKRERPIPEIIKCPNCDCETLRHQYKTLWQCDSCGYIEYR